MGEWKGGKKGEHLKMLGAEGDGDWGGRRGVCFQLQEGKNCISCVDTSTDCFLLLKHTHPPSVTPPHTHPVFFSVTHLHITNSSGSPHRVCRGLD